MLLLCFILFNFGYFIAKNILLLSVKHLLRPFGPDLFVIYNHLDSLIKVLQLGSKRQASKESKGGVGRECLQFKEQISSCRFSTSASVKPGQAQRDVFFRSRL